MIYVVCVLAFVLAGVLVWAIRNQWLLNRVPDDQKRVMEDHQCELSALFEQQVTDAVKVLLWQGFKDKFVLECYNEHNYLIVHNQVGRKKVIRLRFFANGSVLMSVEWREGGSQHTFTCQEVPGLYEIIVTQVEQYGVFDVQYGGVGTHHRRPSNDGLTRLTLVHTNGK